MPAIPNDPLIQRALQVATMAHAGQTRKGSDIPYITHPIDVAEILAKYTNNPQTIAAGLLHDVIEDVDPNIYSEADMRQDFGDHVTEIVKAVSKNPDIHGWREGNEAYIEVLRNTKYIEALEVCAADKISNIGKTLADHAEVGDKVWDRFRAGKTDQQWYYNAVYEMLESRIPSLPILAELKKLTLAVNDL